MAWIPENTEWFLADVVQQIRISGDDYVEVHVLTVLIQAGDPEIAFNKANAWGREHDVQFTNTDGDEVTFSFLGLSGLSVVYDPLEDGAELLDSDYGEATPEKLKNLLVRKEDLNVFKPVEKRNWPGRQDC